MLTVSISLLAFIATGLLLSCIFLVYEHKSPAATMAWLLAIIFLPFLGLAIYFFLGRHRLDMRLRLLHALRDGVGDIREKLEFQRSFDDVIKAAPCGNQYQDIMTLAYRFPGMPPTTGNKVAIHKDAKEAYAEIFKSIRTATEHIHAMYYIIKPDESGMNLRDALVEKAKEGVEVRLMYDDIGSWSMKREFFKPLIDAGGTVVEYRPVQFARFRTLYANFRNHRKILIVDGRTAFTGGINIGDEYLGKDPDFGYWRDTNIVMTGPAASQLQLVFAEDWYYVTGELLTKMYVKEEFGNDEPGSVVQIVPSGPDRSRDQVMHLFFTAITSAHKRLYITTPYFIPDEAVQTALEAAALRGVDVKLLVPKKCDSTMINYASRSYYRELLAAGCQIYEYKKGFVHAKTMTIDGQLGIIGTANMDIRSFRLNFEVCAVCYGGDVARRLEDQFCLDLKDAVEVKLKKFGRRPKADVLVENVARLTSGLL